MDSDIRLPLQEESLSEKIEKNIWRNNILSKVVASLLSVAVLATSFNYKYNFPNRKILPSKTISNDTLKIYMPKESDYSCHHMIIKPPGKMTSENIALENAIYYNASINNYSFHDETLYKNIREQTAFHIVDSLRSESGIDDADIILYIDKTFQKAMLLAKDTVIDEFDCSTAKIYGKKQRNGDGKTPEGIFRINSIIESYNHRFEGKKVYGPNMLHLIGGIYIHGNGTDTVNVHNWMHDEGYSGPEELGLYNNNFGFGKSHGCIRMDNEKIRELIKDGILKLNTPVIIHEDQQLTKILAGAYKDISFDNLSYDTYDVFDYILN